MNPQYKPRRRGSRGYDCWDFARQVLREEFHVDVPEYLDSYQDSRHPAHTSNAIRRHTADFERVICNPKDGDLVLLGGDATHVGVYSSDGRILQLTTAGVTCLPVERIGRRVEGVYRAG